MLHLIVFVAFLLVTHGFVTNIVTIPRHTGFKLYHGMQFSSIKTRLYIACSLGFKTPVLTSLRPHHIGCTTQQALLAPSRADT